MTAEEKYNAIIETIENSVSDEDNLDSPAKIAEAASANSGTTVRDLGSIFNFLTGQSLISYIKERQMMQACREIIESPSYSCTMAMFWTSLGDQPTFIKAFKRCFGITPTEAFKQKDSSLLRPPLTWDRLSLPKALAENAEEDAMPQEKIFGLDAEHYRAAMEATDYQMLYGFSQAQSEAAFALYEYFKNQDVKLKDCFEFVDDFSDYCFVSEENTQDKQDIGWFRELVMSKKADFVHMLNTGMNYVGVQELKQEFEHMKLDLDTMDWVYLDFYLDGRVDHIRFPQIYRFAQEHEDEVNDMERFLEDCLSYGPEAALELDQTFGDVNELYRMADLALEELAEEAKHAGVPEAYADYEEEPGIRRIIRSDWDTDNMAYELDDLDDGYFDF